MAMVDGFFGDSFMEEWDGAPPADLPFMPDGEKVITITAARVDALPWKVKQNPPDGLTLVLTIELPGHMPVEDQIPLNLRGVIGKVCSSAGVERPRSGESYRDFCERLTGQTAPVKTTHRVADSGREYAAIDWLPGIKGAPAAAKAETRAKPPAKRATKQPAPAAAADDADDIPF